MKHFLRFSFLLSLVVAPLWAQTKLGRVDVAVDSRVLLVRVSANSSELQNLALTAFSTHGRYKPVASGYSYDIHFSQAGPSQVRVDVTKQPGASPVVSEVVPGTNLRHALLRAADIAVEKTNGLGLRGYFTGRIAFIRDMGRAKEVCTSDLFFSPGEVKQVTHHNALALSPRWSPDGSRLLFTSYVKGFPDIYQADIVSNQLGVFANYRGSNYGARFSPTGRQVAMVLTGEGSPEIYISDAQGHGPSRRTRMEAAKGAPCWRPDGAQVVFSMQPGPQLYVMSAAGGSIERLASGFAYTDEPDWCRANPNKIACTVRAPGGGFQIAVYDLSKRRAEVVSRAPFDGVEPSWLADGRHLVYTARDRRESKLCILDTETGKSTPIVSPGFGSALQASVWTP